MSTLSPEILAARERNSHTPLCSLPNELLVEVASLLQFHFRSRLDLSRTCHRVRSVVGDPSVLHQDLILDELDPFAGPSSYVYGSRSDPSQLAFMIREAARSSGRDTQRPWKKRTDSAAVGETPTRGAWSVEELQAVISSVRSIEYRPRYARNLWAADQSLEFVLTQLIGSPWTREHGPLFTNVEMVQVESQNLSRMMLQQWASTDSRVPPWKLLERAK
jgi:hypothetical protein